MPHLLSHHLCESGTAFILQDDSIPEGFSLKKARNLFQKYAAGWSPALSSTRGNLQMDAVFEMRLIGSIML